MTRVADPAEQTAWLRDADRRGSVTGYDLAGWEATVWVLHSMYENPSLEPLGTHDDLLRAERAAAKARGDTFDDSQSDPVVRATGVPDDCQGDPGPPWQRLLWADMASRRGRALALFHDWLPHTDWLCRQGWPVSILPPTEGSLDLDDLSPLIDVLVEHSPQGAATPYFAYYCELTSADLVTASLWAGPLGAIAS